MVVFRSRPRTDSLISTTAAQLFFNRHESDQFGKERIEKEGMPCPLAEVLRREPNSSKPDADNRLRVNSQHISCQRSLVGGKKEIVRDYWNAERRKAGDIEAFCTMLVKIGSLMHRPGSL